MYTLGAGSYLVTGYSVVKVLFVLSILIIYFLCIYNSVICHIFNMTFIMYKCSTIKPGLQYQSIAYVYIDTDFLKKAIKKIFYYHVGRGNFTPPNPILLV